MTEKRFEVALNEFDEVEYIMDKEMMEDRDFAEFIDFVEDVCNENEQLKQQNKELQGKASSWKITTSEEMMKQSELMKENEQLKTEIKMLKTTIARNEAYIERITHKGEWRNTSNETD